MMHKPVLIAWIFLSLSCRIDTASDTSNEMSKTEVDQLVSWEFDRQEYADRLEAFWLATSIGNWTGLITEMDKIGTIGPIQTGSFYTREDWGSPDEPNIWDEGVPSQISPTIDFVLRTEDEIWGADDDTDLEYMYQQIILANENPMLRPEQIREGWLTHIASEEENYLWVSNQRAFDLMRQGLLPPETGSPEHNEHFEMIDAQLTTEIFGLYAPGKPDLGRKLAHLPIQTVAREEAEDIALFYVTMFSISAGATLGAKDPFTASQRYQILLQAALQARTYLPEGEYPAHMFDYVSQLHASGIPWEAARDSIYSHYQVQQNGGYDITSQELYCNGCFAAGINFAASLVSLYYGEGDLTQTIQIGSLCGWDSDNPTATWAGLIGFLMGSEAIDDTFGLNLSRTFHIHRTRQGFPNQGIDTFSNMALNGLKVLDLVQQLERSVQE
jgi:hypothetical protein